MYRKYAGNSKRKNEVLECTKTVQLKELNTYFDKLKYQENSETLLGRDEVLDFFVNKMSKDMQISHRTYEFYDLFCGAGGLSVGIEKNGFEVKMAVEKDLSAVKTYHFNRPHLTFSQIIQDDITKHLDDIKLPYAPLIVGGPPCQGFSNANKQQKANDPRNELYKYFVKKVQTVKPEIFLLENVIGILRFFEKIQKDFNSVGYHVKHFTLDTADFGFPQNRKRVFILGFKTEFSDLNLDVDKIFCRQISEHYSTQSFNLMDAINLLPNVIAKTKRNATYFESDEWGGSFIKSIKLNDKYSILLNGGKNKLPILNHKAKYNNPRDIEIYSLLHPGDNSDSEKIAHINPYVLRSDVFKDKFYKLRPDQACKTLTSHMYYDCHMYIHPFQSRGLTPREAARIQGFPDDYLFLGSPNEWYRQIGNAVSPLLSNILGVSCRAVLDRIFSI
jgi:DNA (cytosine-5)-methyltransferase 1